MREINFLKYALISFVAMFYTACAVNQRRNGILKTTGENSIVYTGTIEGKRYSCARLFDNKYECRVNKEQLKSSQAEKIFFFLQEKFDYDPETHGGNEMPRKKQKISHY